MRQDEARALTRQLTKDEALALADSGAWKDWDAQTRAIFQMRQDRLCMPFGEFHGAVEKAIGRPVFTHEFGLNRAGLLAELEGRASAPTLDEVIGLLPADKTIVVATGAAS